MANLPQINECDRILVVEGYSDLLFYAELLEHLGRLQGAFIKQFNGRQDLATKLEIFLTPQLYATKSAIGIIVDADTDARAVSVELSQLISRSSGQNVRAGLWTNNNPRIGLFVAPDGTSAGEVESLVWSAWSADPINAQQRECVKSYIDCMGNIGLKSQSYHKGLLGSLLAIRYDDDPRLGPGARKGVFDFGRPEYGPLKQFLSEF